MDFIWSPPNDIVQPCDAQPCDAQPGDAQAGDAREDRTLTYRVMTDLPVIVLEGDERRSIKMRWGFPHPDNWQIPQPIHARAETIETVKAFAKAFRDGQRGIVLMRSFNEAPDVKGPTLQHVITPGDAPVLAAAVVWRRYDISARPTPLFACVLVTVPANRLISTLPTDRMPAFLSSEDWQVWLGEAPASLEEVKACLKTVEGVNWKMTPEERAKTAKRSKPVVSDPAGLF